MLPEQPLSQQLALIFIAEISGVTRDVSLSVQSPLVISQQKGILHTENTFSQRGQPQSNAQQMPK